MSPPGMQENPDQGEATVTIRNALNQTPFAYGFPDAFSFLPDDITFVLIPVMKQIIPEGSASLIRNARYDSKVFLRYEVLPEKGLQPGTRVREKGGNTDSADRKIKPVDGIDRSSCLTAQQFGQPRRFGAYAGRFYTDSQHIINIQALNHQTKPIPFRKMI